MESNLAVTQAGQPEQDRDSFFDRIKDRASFILGIAAVTSGLALAINSSSADAKINLPAQGVYDSCNIAKTLNICKQRLGRIGVNGGAGFNVALEEDGLDGDMSQLNNYMNASINDGVKIIWSLQNDGWWQNYNPNGNNMLGYYPSFTEACGAGCNTNEKLLGFIVDTLKGKATYGFYIADDSQIPQNNPTPYLSGLSNFTKDIRQYAPNAQTVVSVYKVDSSGNTIAQYYKAKAATEVVQESYPEDSDKPPSVDNTPTALNRLANQVKPAAEAVKNAEAQTGEKAGFVGQAWAKCDSEYDDPTQFKTHDCTFPTGDQLVTMRNTMINIAHPNLILYYNYDQVAGYPKGQSLSYWYNPTGATAAMRFSRLKYVVTTPDQ